MDHGRNQIDLLKVLSSTLHAAHGEIAFNHTVDISNEGDTVKRFKAKNSISLVCISCSNTDSSYFHKEHVHRQGPWLGSLSLEQVL